MKKINLLGILVLLLSLAYSQSTEAQCPNCTIVLPAGIPADTIVVDSLPSAYKNAYYEEEMSYRLPYTTDPLAAVAPPGTNVPTGLSIDHFKVLSVTGLPPGLSWRGDRPAPMLYNEVAPATRDGCITLCGTPGSSGIFTVNVNLEIQISGFVFPSPPIPLTFEVFPDTNASFVVDTGIGCAPFQVVITNLVPSNGNPSISYFWDFGNGQTSTMENPDTVVYDFGIMADTTVAIVQQIVTDTFPYLLESVVVATDPGNSCNDDVGTPPLGIAGAPDMYMILIGNGDTVNTDPNFGIIGNTQNNEYPRDTMVFPGPVELVNGQSYTLEIWDDDNASFNPDDPCGNGPVTLSAALGAGTHTLTTGSMTIEVTISHLIDTVEYVDSITVEYCPVLPDTTPKFAVDTAMGCAPFAVVITNLFPSNGNTGISYFWDFGNGQTSTMENPDTVRYDFGITTDSTVAITQRIIIDTFASGRIDTIVYVDSITVEYCNINVNYVETVNRTLKISPNPTSDKVNVSFQLDGLGKEVELVVSDVLGRTVYTEAMENVAGEYNRGISLAGQANGLYLLQLRIGDQLVTRKVVLQD